MPLIEIRSATITEKGQIAIPKQMRKLSGFKTGTKIVILVFDNRIELRPMKQIREDIANAVASEKILAKDWNSKDEDEAWKNL